MKKFTVYLPDWLHTRLEKLMHEHGMLNMSDAIRTMLIFSVKDFEAFVKELGLEAAEEEPEDPEQRALAFFKLLYARLESAGVLQNPIVPGFPADFEPATNRVGEGHTARGQFSIPYEKIPLLQDPMCDLIQQGGKS